MNISENELRTMLQSCCEHYFKDRFQANRFLYFTKIPHSYFGTDYKVKISSIKFSWDNEPKMKFTTHKVEDSDFGKKKCEFEQDCLVSYYFKVNDLLEVGRETKTIRFYAESIEPYDQNISCTVIEEDLVLMDNYRKVKQDLKRLFQIENIDEVRYEIGNTGFGFFADILRKQRSIHSQNENISHGNFYYELAHCHGEIEICLVTALFNQKYSSDLLGKKASFNGKDFFMPNLNYNDIQYLTMIGFGFDRLYSFWDRIAYLLYNYETLDFKNNYEVSFDKYFVRLNKFLNLGKQIVFNKNSSNLNWLINFHEKNFVKITEYRHRIVHYQMRPDWAGVLSSKFANNTSQYVSDEKELKKIKLEFDGLGYLLYEQFNFCKEGFVKALMLIDELN